MASSEIDVNGRTERRTDGHTNDPKTKASRRPLLTVEARTINNTIV